MRIFTLTGCTDGDPAFWKARSAVGNPTLYTSWLPLVPQVYSLDVLALLAIDSNEDLELLTKIDGECDLIQQFRGIQDDDSDFESGFGITRVLPPDVTHDVISGLLSERGLHQPGLALVSEFADAGGYCDLCCRFTSRQYLDVTVYHKLFRAQTCFACYVHDFFLRPRTRLEEENRVALKHYYDDSLPQWGPNHPLVVTRKLTQPRE